jgi:polysaccharide biosynthesis/export protein
MRHDYLRFQRQLSNALALLFAYCVLSTAIHAQAAPAEQSLPTASQSFVADDYQIGPGDVLAISVTDAPEFSGKFRVDQSGFLVMSSLGSPLKAEGKTPMQLSRELVKALEDARLYRDPTVNIFVEEYHSKTVAVVGAVAKPGLYPLQRRTTVIEVISEAGLLPTAGNRVTIIPPATNPKDPTSQPASRTVELARLMQGKDSSLNVVVHDGEVISVASAEVVYVVGAVTKPGGFVLQDRSAGVTALQAIALAQGMTPVASAKRGLIIRRNSDGSARENLPVDLSRIMTGKQGDVQLDANDILFVPVSGSKQTLRAMGEAAMTAVNGVTFYGLGYRVAGL